MYLVRLPTWPTWQFKFRIGKKASWTVLKLNIKSSTIFSQLDVEIYRLDIAVK